MNEADWLACDDPRRMLEFVRGKVSDRKLRLFAFALAWTQWRFLEDGPGRRAVEMVARFADSLATADELSEARRAAHTAFAAHPRPPERPAEFLWQTQRFARLSALAVSGPDAYAAALHAVTVADRPELVARLREIMGNPYRPPPPLPPSVLAYDGGLVVRLATAAYELRSLPDGHLDNDRLAVLADALEDAGLLGHLRGGVHVRGCYAVDLVLGKR